MHTKGERTCGSYVRSTCRAKRHPGRGLAPNANDGGGRHAPTTRVARASVARLAPTLPSAAPAEKGDGSNRSWRRKTPGGLFVEQFVEQRMLNLDAT